MENLESDQRGHLVHLWEIIYRWNSWSLATKCLIVALIPLDWSPLMYAAATVPFKWGSSENDSKLRPPRGDRCVLTVGARRTWQPGRWNQCGEAISQKKTIPFARASSPNAFPTSRARSISNEEASPVDDGKQLEGMPLKTDFAHKLIWG